MDSKTNGAIDSKLGNQAENSLENILVNEKENSLNYDLLSKEEQNQVDNISRGINLASSSAILNYGVSIQNKMVQFSESAIQNVKTTKAGEAGDILSSLVSQINLFDAPDYNKNLISKLFFQSKKAVKKLIANYSQIETNVDKIVLELEKNRIQMMKDIALYDNMYKENLDFYKQISLHIIAGEQKIKEIREHELPRLTKAAEASKEQMDVQIANDLSDVCNKFDKKILDLKMTRIIAIQMAPQIRMLQNNEIELAEKIQSAITNTIPLWKSQLLLALGIVNTRTAYRMQNAVSDATNELLKKNSALLKQGSIEIAKESQRSIVDTQTLRQTNADIIQTLDEVLNIHREGAQLRLSAEQELLEVEAEMKKKLSELRTDARQ